MASPKPFLARLSGCWRWLPYGGALALFLWLCAQFYVPNQGFTYLAMFGGKVSASYLPELRAMDFYAERDSYGYDAQYYAQIAIHPKLGDPVLRDAVDSLPYRARRILFCWTAYLFGLGRPEWVLQVFCVQNIIAWLLLGWVLLRWFPPTQGQNFVRWFAMMFTFGLCFSVRGSLVDGPSLLLIAIAMALVEKHRQGWAAVVLAVAGLGKETNILAAAALAPARWRDRRGWGAAIWRGIVVIAPLALWIGCLKLWLGTGGDAGARNFDWPFVGYMHKWRETLAPFFTAGSGVIGRSGLYVLIGLTVQWLFLALRPRWNDPWWRLGAVYALLMVMLGDAVWEGYPGAASRVLLPMTLAFNVSLPRGRRWWAVLVLGNLMLLPSFDTMVPPGRESFRVFGARDLRVEEATGDELKATFDEQGWYGLERSYFDYWEWSRGSAAITFHNPHPYPVTITAEFRLKSTDERTVTIRMGDKVLWTGPVGQRTPDMKLGPVVLAPGDTRWDFVTDHPAVNPPNGDLRKVAFRLEDLTLTVLGRAQ